MTWLHRYRKLTPGVLEKRYKRFLADVRLQDGSTITVFTPNSGSMKTCSDPDSPVMLLHDPGPDRKTQYNLEMVMSGRTWVGVNTGLANLLGAAVLDAALTGHPQLDGFRVEKREFTWGDSRFDLKITNGRKEGFVEIKNVTYRSGDTALFPDAVTARGKKHLETLIRARAEGYIACNLYIVQRSDCTEFAPAREIDPAYSDTMLLAAEKGVIMAACMMDIRPEGIRFVQMLPISLGEE